ncbi:MULTISPECIES: KdsC family phosphatase [Methylococcus]|uniref:KdsC family phosphatase n=1 Tax=Methylococcus TaxID=413 RepID=UPI001C5300FE|nr:HAD family hydrolase [Methylococcus capsulatus]QXP88472.1 HAD family hydrolase [Methylococcus capsulatus]QXP90177.1 HAD family hydrolase [Methylococcus capsulatus]QXP94512.1 HAD family hydrolase [Methylococcus capsulatus]UQN13520.1 HAD family hydrolase [Methylococcus capsulatus]
MSNPDTHRCPSGERPFEASREVLARAAAIRLVIFDVDGVLTDGTLFFDLQRIEYKAFHTRDGLGIRLLRESGVEVAVISGRESEIVRRRMESLGVRHCFQGCEDKLEAFGRLQTELGLTDAQIAHVGDDLPDVPLFRRAGLAVAVADAHPVAAKRAHWLTARNGGNGAAREVCDLIMHAQGTLDLAMARFL